jgi:hypothetical protein
MQKPRMVITTAMTVLEIFKDYLTEEYIPTDAIVTGLMVKPSEQGKFALVIQSDSIKPGLDPLMVNFDLRRVYGLGGPSNE